MANALALYGGVIKAASRQFGIPEELLRRQILAESGGNPHAKSPVGALGLMQLMPSTARGLGVQNPLDPRENIMGGARYLAEQKAKFGNWREALAAYNAGPASVVKYGGVPPFAETRDYVNKILGSLPDVGAAPQMSSPAATASAGMGSSAPTPQGPNYMAMASQMAQQAQNAVAPDTTDNTGQIASIPTPDPYAWKQYLPSNGGGDGVHPTQFNAMLRAGGPRLSAPVHGTGSAIVHAARSYLGVPYKWGGTSRQGGMDCSGFLQNVFKNVGVSIPRTTYEQVRVGQAVRLRDLQPGDAVFTEPGHAGPNHVGLYIGHGMIQESPHTGTVNSIIPLKNFLGGGFVAARRYTHMMQPKQGKGKK